MIEREWVENRPTAGAWPRLALREAWAFRDVGVILAERDVKVRYKQTFFGVAWALIQPLAAMVVFTLVLGRLDGLSSEGVPYSAFVIAGLAVWFPFSAAVGNAAESLVSAPDLVTKVYFPRLLAPLGAVLAVVVDLAIALGIALVVALVAGVRLQAAVILLPACALAVIAVALALGLWLAALNVLYRDVRYAVAFFMQLLFFASPIVYASSVVEGSGDWLFALNPVVGLVELTRWSLLGTAAPGPDALVSLASTVVLLAGGLAFFRRTEQQFADRI
jgi:lipopolysaccharide transport system permease protein